MQCFNCIVSPFTLLLPSFFKSWQVFIGKLNAESSNKEERNKQKNVVGIFKQTKINGKREELKVKPNSFHCSAR
jgi:hypothetical protein